MNQRVVRSQHSAARAAGFTLIELMIAMILGLIVIAGVTSVFLAGQQSFRTNHALSEVQDSSRIAFELMARDVRQAGLTGCDSFSGRVANVLNNSGTDWWANFGNALHGYGGANSSASDGDVDQVDPAVTTGTAATNRVAGTDSLEILGADGLPVTIATDNEPAANFKLNASTDDLASGDIILVCSPDHATITQISNYNSSNVTVVHNTGASFSPGNCSKGLGYPTICTTNGNIYSFPQNSSIARMDAHDWYIGYNGEGGTSLYRVALANTGGTTITPTAQEMVRNVTDMQITYLQGGTTYVAANAVTDWGKVTAVHVVMSVESTFQRATVDAKPLTRTFAFTTTLRNRVD